MDFDERYRVTLETRNLEIRLFWERSNFFLALNGAIAIGFFSLDNRSLSLALAVFGGVCSALWIVANLGSRFWQARWEGKLTALERENFPDAGLFSESYDDITAQVKACLDEQARWFLPRWINRAVLARPSVSLTAILLSIWFLLAWIGFAVWGIAHG